MSRCPVTRARILNPQRRCPRELTRRHWGRSRDEIDNLSDAISSSESAQELSSAWDALKVELAAIVATLRAEGTVAREDVDSALDAFQQELDALDIEESVTAAWDDLRSHLEQLTS